MRPVQAVMAELAASGLTPEQQALIMELSAAVAVEARPAIDRAAENKRAYDREYRRNRKNRTKSCEHTDSKGSNDRDILTSKASKNSEPKGSSKNGARLPLDWQPKPLIDKTAEMVTAWPAGMMERELAKFRDYWLKTPGAKGRSLDWDASYRNWLRNADERRPRSNERPDNPTTIAVQRLIGTHH